MGQLVRVPANEAQRLLTVRSLNAIHSSPTPELAVVAELAREVFASPYAAINIIDEDWQRIAGQAGLDRKSTRLNSSHITPSRMPSSA